MKSLLACAVLAGCWQPTSPPALGRFRHTATMLREADLDGPRRSVIVIGGCDRSPGEVGCETASTEFFLQDTGAWEPGPDLLGARFGHASVRLRDHTVLVVGGLATRDGTLTTDGAVAAERLMIPQMSPGWAPTFVPAGSLVDGRINHTATLLPDGRVLVVGGMRVRDDVQTFLASVEIWDPLAGTFTASDPLPTGRAFHTATALPGGEVLVVGGRSADAELATTTIFDPGADPGAHWRTGPALPVAVPRHAAVLVGGGSQWRLVVSGAASFAASVTPDPSGRAVLGPFTSLGPLGQTRSHHVAAVTATGHIMVIGGLDANNQVLDSVEILAPGATVWSGGPALSTPRGQHHAATALPDGRILVTGGAGAPQSADLLRFCSPDHCATRLASCLCPTECPDGDGDGFSDAWETGGIDSDFDGDIDITLPGADPAQRDLYIEVDYMVENGASCGPGEGVPGTTPLPGCHKPFQTTLDSVRRAFADEGYRVHLEVSSAIPWHEVVTHGGCSGRGDDVAALPDLKRRYSPASRRGLYHHVLFADALCDAFYAPRTGELVISETATSVGEVYGDDVTVRGGASAVVQGGALVHELGHNLGFGHAGPPTAPFSPPNYQSVMGGGFLRDPDVDVDGDHDVDEDGDVDSKDVDALLVRQRFSPGGLGALDEQMLFEASGVPGAVLPYAVTFACPPGVTTTPKVPCAGVPGPRRRACTQLVSRQYIHRGPGEPPQVVQWWRVVARDGNRIDWNCNGTFDFGAVGPLNLNNTWKYAGARVDHPTIFGCKSDSVCLGGRCENARCVYPSHQVEHPITDLFPGFRDRDHMVPAFQCHSSSDSAGDDLPVFGE